MNITVITVKKILNVWFSEMSSQIALHATVKKLKKSCLHAAFSAREAMVKPLSPPPRNQHAVGVPPPVVRPVANNGKNN